MRYERGTSIMIDFSTPLQSMQTDMDRVSLAGSRIAQAAQANSGNGLELSPAVIARIEARNAVAANMKVAKTVDEMARTLIDAWG
jgi:hypothetical protein